jgi:hypothetical protein
METHYKNFVTVLYKFLVDLHRYTSSTGIQKILDVYDKLDMAKVIFKINTILSKYNQQIDNGDETIFSQPILLLPEIDLSVLWPSLIKGQKSKIFTYLKIIKLESNLLVNFKEPVESPVVPETSQTTSLVPVENKNPVEQPDFNPYVGIGNNDSAYGVNEMFSATPTFQEDKPSGPGIETIANLIGIDKMINMSELTEQLKNMNKDEIENATNSIKQLLGSNVDNSTSNLISDMLTSISDELKKSNLKSDNPISNIVKIAETVAGKMKPKMEEQNIDITQLFNSTQSLAQQCKDDKGNPLFNEQMNPFSLLNQLTAGNLFNKNGTQEEYMQQCNTMLQNMGLKNIDLGNINNLQQQLQGGMNNKNNKNNGSGKRKKKK